MNKTHWTILTSLNLLFLFILIPVSFYVIIVNTFLFTERFNLSITVSSIIYFIVLLLFNILYSFIFIKSAWYYKFIGCFVLTTLSFSITFIFLYNLLHSESFQGSSYTEEINSILIQELPPNIEYDSQQSSHYVEYTDSDIDAVVDMNYEVYELKFYIDDSIKKNDIEKTISILKNHDLLTSQLFLNFSNSNSEIVHIVVKEESIIYCQSYNVDENICSIKK